MSAHFLPSNGKTSQVSLDRVNLEEASNLITERARKLIARLIESRQREEPPFLPAEVARLHRVKDVVKTDLGELNAMVVRLGDGYVIKVNKNHPEVRQNFSCAHEIGHILLDELVNQRFSNGTDFRGVSQVTGKAKERLCDIAATELLMPAPIFSKYLSGFGICISSVDHLARIFRVSIPAAAIRIAELSQQPCFAVQWKRCQKNRSKGFLQAWPIGPREMWNNNGKPIYVRDPSALLKAYESNDTIKSFKGFKIGNSSKRCRMESKGFGYDKTRYVVSLVFPDR